MGPERVSRLRPTTAQIRAADPAHSAWVGANAGSGKTRVLTQRVARLLLAGWAPETILCLTYTKAAAVEMQERLFATLGGWAMAPDAALAADLAALEGAASPDPDPARLARARRLFAAALETPGGLKIQTIHAFCARLLRRFPLEAGVSPSFRVLDEAEARRLLTEIRRDLAREAETGGSTAFDRIAARAYDKEVEALTQAVLTERATLARPLDPGRLAQAFGEAAEGRRAAAVRALGALDWPALTRLGAEMALTGSTMATPGARIADAVARAATDPEAALEALLAAFLTKGRPRERRQFPTRPVLQRMPEADALTDAMIAWAVAAREALAKAELAERTRDLSAFAVALLQRYEAAKARDATLDYTDLVARTAALLDRSEDRAWVLFKLDRGISHILVDEAQDTAPEQWRVVMALADEFLAGEGGGPEGRTLFVVGDEKQSIYSFQGADPRVFQEMRVSLRRRLSEGPAPLVEPALVTSFRSAPGILAFVDAVFEGREAALTDGRIAHEASRAGDGARVDLWPLVEPEPAAEAPDWWRPQPVDPGLAPKPRLARRLAADLARMIATERRPSRGGGPGAPIRPGDILVLVRRRDALARELIKALKSEGVPVAGADRLALAQGLAVQDLMALIRVALTPSDDLALAGLLRSPFVDLDEAALFDLAHGRPGTLLAALASSEHREAAALVADMAARADFLRPYEFLERALLHHGGRGKLVARLGPEAEDLVDELLEQALAYEAEAVPSLAGFLAWVETGERVVKREMEAAGDAVRVMTVHGAKGLEAPVVVLADTVAQASSVRRVAVDAETGLALWLPRSEQEGERAAKLKEQMEARAAEERQRLLYVALTRAEDVLILCGAGDARKVEKDWYGQLSAAMDRLGAREVPRPDGPIRRLGEEPEPSMAASEARPATPAPPDAPGRSPPEARPRRLAPSGLGALLDGAKAAPKGRDRREAIAHGLAVHRLLETGAPAEADLARDAPELDPEAREAALREARAVLAAPWAAEIFGPDSMAEAPLALALPEIAERPMLGRIDRLVVTPARVLVVDIKTDRRMPARADDADLADLAQLAAYRAALAQIWTDRPVEGALLYSAGPRLLHVAGDCLDALLLRLAAASGRTA